LSALLTQNSKLETGERGFEQFEQKHSKPLFLFKQTSKLHRKYNSKMQNTARQPIIPHTSYLIPLKDEIQYDDFAKMDIRTATITAAERIPKADKLLKLTVDLGFEQRTVASGIAEHFTPEEVVGQRVLLLANLAPRKIRGVESQGMILMAENAEGKLSFVQAGEAFGPGLGVK
jgi:methionyl-tRNA synthetase